MKTVTDFLEGQLLLIDKPLEWSSFQVVNKLRWAICHKFGIKKLKVGHAGTLDPLATGLLIICTGKMTKKIDSYQGLDKAYTGVLELGSTTPSYDKETEIDQRFPTDHITDELIENTLKQFQGDIKQLPPIFSAVKKDGKRLYEYARKGKHTEIEPRSVSINRFLITGRNGDECIFEVNCSKGTYIRSLVHDFGKALDSGAHLKSLQRTAIGEYRLENAKTIDEFLQQLNSE